MRVFSKLLFVVMAFSMPPLIAGCGPSVDNSPPPTAAEMEAETEELAAAEEAEELEAMREAAGEVDDEAADEFGDET